MQDYVGYRTKRRQSQKKKKRKLWRWLLAVAILVAVFIILGAAVRVYPFDKAWDKTADGFKWLGRKIKSIWPWKAKSRIPPTSFLPEGKKTANYLLAVTKQIEGTIQLSTLVLASYDSRDDSASLIYVPSDLMVDVPGVGTDVISNLVELDDGRISMALITVENLLGVNIDRYIMGSDRDLSIMSSKLGWSFRVDVPSKVSFTDPSLKVTLNLKKGEQVLEGRDLVSYLTYAPSGQEMDLIARQQGFVPQSMEKSRSVLNDIPKITRQFANLFDSDATYKEMAGIWQAFALVKPSKSGQGTVPVKEFKIEKTVVHRVDQQKIPAFIDKYVKSDYRTKSSSRLKVEILNGCGAPGVGEKVTSQLDLNKFTVVNSANADNFDYPQTLIIVYSNSAEVAEGAEQIRKALEVGSIEARPANQNISDITIVVGKDYASK